MSTHFGATNKQALSAQWSEKLLNSYSVREKASGYYRRPQQTEWILNILQLLFDNVPVIYLTCNMHLHKTLSSFPSHLISI